MFEIAKEIDPVTNLGTFDKKTTWLQPGDLPGNMALWGLLKPIELNTKVGKKVRCFLHMVTSKRIGDIKSKQQMKQYLWPNQIFLNVEQFSARPVATVGWIKYLNHRAIRFDKVQEELTRLMRGVEADP